MQKTQAIFQCLQKTAILDLGKTLFSCQNGLKSEIFFFQFYFSNRWETAQILFNGIASSDLTNFWSRAFLLGILNIGLLFFLLFLIRRYFFVALFDLISVFFSSLFWDIIFWNFLKAFFQLFFNFFSTFFQLFSTFFNFFKDYLKTF